MAEPVAEDTIAFIGLGAMGAPMAARLVKGGFPVRVYDVAEAPREALQEEGAVVATTAEQSVRRAGIVVLMLPNSDVVEKVAQEIQPSLQNGALVIDMSSSEPLRTRALAERLAPAVHLIDAPVSGGITGARRGKLTVMVGGESEQIARARKVLKHLGTIKEAGPIGAGHAAKALNNLLSATHLWVTSEAIHAGAQFGLDPEALLDIFNTSSGRSGSTENKWPNYVLPGTYDSGFALGLMLKDMRIATTLAREVGFPSLLGEQAVDRWAAAEQALANGADHTEVAHWIAQKARIFEQTKH